jgi:glycosyltransferase involved in cell wall biosynthesis
MIKVSVITPVFNCAHLVEQTILSVLKQQFQEWEMILVDDGSSDNTQEVIEQYTKEDSRMKFFQQPHAGASAARNTGIKNAKNDWLLFLDADDWIREDFFEKMISELETNPFIDVVHCGWTRISKNGIMAKENYGSEQTDMFPLLAHYCPFAIHSCIARKKIVEDVGGFDTSFKTCGDWDLWQRVARTGARFQMIKETLAYYRTTSNSLSSDGNKFCINGLQVISNAYAFDGRVSSPKPEYKNGLKADDLAERKYYFVSWSAGLLIGSNKSALHLLEHLKGLTASNLNPGLLAETLIDSIIIPAEKDHWISHWNLIENNLKSFLTALEKQCEAKYIADKVSSLIERHIIIQAAGQIEHLQIGNSYAEKIDIESPIADKILTNETKSFFGIVYLKENLLDVVEVKSPDKFLPASLIKDVIATKSSWQILQYFFSQTVYPFLKLHNNLRTQLSEQELHDKIGWEVFLQQLWQKPDWKERMFYDASATKKENTLVIEVQNEAHIEIGDVLPTIKTAGAVLKVIYYIAEVETGSCLCDVKKNYVYPQMLRAAITLSGKNELCRVTVCEVLIGQKLDSGLNLRQRLNKRKMKSEKQ